MKGTTIISIDALIAGDDRALRQFVRTYQDMAFTLALSIVKDEHVAEEVAQDAFLKAFKGIRSFRQTSSLKTWFYRIVVNEALARLKRIKAEILSFCESYEEDNLSDEGDIQGIEEKELQALLNAALKKMVPNESLALRLHYLEDCSVRDMAVITGWTEANIKVILHRARKSLFQIIRRNKLITSN